MKRLSSLIKHNRLWNNNCRYNHKELIVEGVKLLNNLGYKNEDILIENLIICSDKKGLVPDILTIDKKYCIECGKINYYNNLNDDKDIVVEFNEIKRIKRLLEIFEVIIWMPYTIHKTNLSIFYINKIKNDKKINYIITESKIKNFLEVK